VTEYRGSDPRLGLEAFLISAFSGGPSSKRPR